MNNLDDDLSAGVQHCHAKAMAVLRYPVAVRRQLDQSIRNLASQRGNAGDLPGVARKGVNRALLTAEEELVYRSWKRAALISYMALASAITVILFAIGPYRPGTANEADAGSAFTAMTQRNSR